MRQRRHVRRRLVRPIDFPRRQEALEWFNVRDIWRQCPRHRMVHRFAGPQRRDCIVPPLQANLAQRGLADGFAKARYFKVERVERPQGLPPPIRREQCRQPPVAVMAPDLIRAVCQIAVHSRRMLPASPAQDWPRYQGVL
jgi:hypothetical protein